MNPNSVAAPRSGLMQDIMPPYAKAFNKTMAAKVEVQASPAPTPTPTAPSPVATGPATPQELAAEVTAAPIPVEKPASESSTVQPMFPTEVAAAPLPTAEVAPVQPQLTAEASTPHSAAASPAKPAHHPKTNWLVISLAVIVALGLAAAAYFALKGSS